MLCNCLILIASCNSPKYQVFEGYAQGTTFRMVYQSNENYNDTLMKMLKYFDKTLSIYQDSSMISLINNNDSSVVLNDLFIQFYQKSREVFEKSDGYFDITVAPLVQTWGFGPKGFIKSDSASIDSILKFVGMNKIKLENKKIIKSDPRVQLDGNAIAQGQSVDYVSNFLESNGTKNYMIEIGGELRAKGINAKGESWKIGIDKPIEGSDEKDRELQTIVKIKDKSLATSGNYRKFHLVNGIKYSHEINPKTGYPAKDILLSASVLADECSIADGFATACMVLGYSKAKELISNNKNLEAYFIYSGKDGKLEVYMSPGFKKYLAK
jgi:FAD:protein FMN transferase